MSIELNLGPSTANLTINLGEFLDIAKDIVNDIAGITKHHQARHALKDAIGEIRRTYDTTIDVFTPLNEVTDQADFAKRFGTLQADFKNSYLKNTNAVRTHCTIVKRHLDDLLQKKEWTDGWPLLERSYTRLKALCGEWLYSDFALSEQMDSFLKSINDFYRDISELAQHDAPAAFAALRSGLKPYEDAFGSLKKQLDELDVVGRAL